MVTLYLTGDYLTMILKLFKIFPWVWSRSTFQPVLQKAEINCYILVFTKFIYYIILFPEQWVEGFQPPKVPKDHNLTTRILGGGSDFKMSYILADNE